MLPTLRELAGADVPKDTDGISFLPTLLGKGNQKKHEFLYWEFPGYGGQQAVRWGDWKGIRTNLNRGLSPIELYNAARHPDIVERIAQIMADNHTPSALFPMRALDPPGK